MFELWGASGGGAYPGFGAYVSGTLKIDTRTKFHIYVGQKGIDNGTASFNGGGSGKNQGSSGGGSTDIRLKGGDWDDFESLKSRIIVAGAGGGSNIKGSHKAKGGDAGIFEGYDGSASKLATYIVDYAQGGKQNEGGYQGTGRTNGYKGDFGKGGNSGGENNLYGNVGGSGYFGGVGGALGDNSVGSGAGGSSFVSGLERCKAILKTTKQGTFSFSDLPFHYSYHIFSNITVKDGASTQWNDNGKVVITLLTSIRDKYFTCMKAAPRTKSYLFVFILISS